MALPLVAAIVTGFDAASCSPCGWMDIDTAGNSLPGNLNARGSARLALMAAKEKGRFIAPMLLLRTDTLPTDANRWEYQLKFDGYRAVAFKSGGKVHLRSRNDNDFSIRYPDVVKGLAKLPDETVIDGEVIALDADGRPSFNILQNSSAAPVLYRCSSRRSRSWSGRAKITCGTPRSLRYARTSPHGRFGGSNRNSSRRNVDTSNGHLQFE